MPTLSLCMIVRNEEVLLPRFLQHAEDLWDDLCVVDTGSSDRTQQILKEAGARIFSFDWQDNFSEARNFGLKHAQGDWILVLDADEMVGADFKKELKQCIQDPNLGAATVNIKHTLMHGHRAQVSLLRLWQNDPGIEFDYPIHEDAHRGVKSYLLRTGLTLGHINAEIEHLGYRKLRAEQRGKKQRDQHILKRWINENPEDLFSWYKLMELSRFWQDEKLAKQLAPDVLNVLQQCDEATLSNAHYAGELIVMLADALYTDNTTEKLQDKLQFINGYIDRIYPSKALSLRRGEIYEQLQEEDLASEAYQACIALGDGTGNIQLGTVRPLLGLARLAIRQGHNIAALDWVQRALHEVPRDAEALLALIAIGWQIGGIEVAQSLAMAYTEDYGETPELHAAIAEAALLAKTPHIAKEAIAEAIRLEKSQGTCYDAEYLAQYQQLLQKAEEALQIS